MKDELMVKEDVIRWKCSQGLNTFRGWLWVPKVGGVCDTLL